MINQERVTKNFIRLGAIDSPPFKEAKMVKEVVRQLRPLVDSVQVDKMGNIVAKKKGQGKPILLCAHTDTVFSNGGSTPSVRKGVISNWGKGLCGADNKAAVVAILEALTSLKEDDAPTPSIEIVFTVQEEIGLVGVREVDFNKLKAKEGLCFDRATDVPTVVLASPHSAIFDIFFYGKAAHSGAHPEKGINAIAAMADFINRFKLGRVNKETTMNFGVICGGVAGNVVPDECKVEGEVRSLNKETRDKILKQIKSELKKVEAKHKVKSKLVMKFLLPGYKFDQSTPLIKEIKQTHKRLGWKTKTQLTNAGADANWINGQGIVTVNTGYGAKHVHSVNEQQSVRQLVRLSRFIETFLKKRASSK